MEEPRHRFPAIVLEIPRGDATVARGHGERRRPRRGEPAGAAEQPEAGGFQPRRRDADDLSDLEPSRVLRLRSGEGPRGRSGDGVPESHPAEISAQAHDRVGHAAAEPKAGPRLVLLPRPRTSPPRPPTAAGGWGRRRPPGRASERGQGPWSPS